MQANRIELEASLLSATLLEYLVHKKAVDGLTVKELLTALTDVVTNYDRKPIPRIWPRSPQALSAHLKRIAPALRRDGWTVIFHGHCDKGSTLSIGPYTPLSPDELLTNSETQKSSSGSSSAVSSSNGAVADEPDELDELSLSLSVRGKEKEREERKNGGEKREKEEKTGGVVKGNRESSSSSSVRQPPAKTLGRTPDEVADELLTNPQSASACPRGGAHNPIKGARGWICSRCDTLLEVVTG